MEHHIYQNSLSEIKMEVAALQEQEELILAKNPYIIGKKEEWKSPGAFKQGYKIKEIRLRQIYFHISAIRLSKEAYGKPKKNLVDQGRNSITMLLSLWEDNLGKNFMEIYESEHIIRSTLTNLDVMKHFLLIGYAIDRVEQFIIESKIETSKQFVMLRIRYKFIMMFTNALNFKALIREIEAFGTNYASSKQIIETVYREVDICAEHLWKYYFISSAKQPNIFEMQRSLTLINFVKKISSFLMDKDRISQYKKKHNTWKKYIDKASAQIA